MMVRLSVLTATLAVGIFLGAIPVVIQPKPYVVATRCTAALWDLHVPLMVRVRRVAVGLCKK